MVVPIVKIGDGFKLEKRLFMFFILKLNYMFFMLNFIKPSQDLTSSGKQ